MIDKRRIGIVGTLGIIRRRRFLVAVIKKDVGRRGRFQVRQGDPDIGKAVQVIVFFDMIGQRGLVVASDEPQVRAIRVGVVEREIAGIEPDQDRRGADRIRDIAAGRTRIDGDRLASSMQANKTKGRKRNSAVAGRRSDLRMETSKSIRDRKHIRTPPIHGIQPADDRILY
jgi:hypothetical protein